VTDEKTFPFIYDPMGDQILHIAASYLIRNVMKEYLPYLFPSPLSSAPIMHVCDDNDILP